MSGGPKKLLLTFLRIVAAGVFLYAGVLKIRDPVGFAGSIAAYQLLPYFGNYAVAAVLPWIEVLAGALLLAGIRLRGAATLLFLLNLVFIVALVSVIARGLSIDCGCFRQGGAATSPWIALGRDLLLSVALFLVVRGHRPCRYYGRP